VFCFLIPLHYLLSSEHNACTLHRKVRKPKSSASSVRQRITQWHNQSTLFSSHTIITELLTCDVQPVNQHWHIIYVVMELNRKKRSRNQITFTSTLIRQFIWVGSRQQLASVSMTEIVLSGFSIKTSPIVTCLGVKIDAELTLSTHVKQVAAGCFCQLHQLWSIRPAVTSDML